MRSTLCAAAIAATAVGLAPALAPAAAPGAVLGAAPGAKPATPVQAPVPVLTPAPAPRGGVLPAFAAHYVAEWKDISVGVSDLKLEPGPQPGSYHYRWTISARGIFRLLYSDDVTQQSWFRVVDDHVRPERYRGEQGSSSVSFDFDWAAGHALGVSEGKPIDLSLKSGTQDLMSIQTEVMLDLMNDSLPPLFHIIDKDQVKDFIYTREGTAKLRTALGSLDTVVVSSRRAGNDRILRMWFATALDFIPVQAERWRGGKLEFAMRLRSLQR